MLCQSVLHSCDKCVISVSVCVCVSVGNPHNIMSNMVNFMTRLRGGNVFSTRGKGFPIMCFLFIFRCFVKSIASL